MRALVVVEMDPFADGADRALNAGHALAMHTLLLQRPDHGLDSNDHLHSHSQNREGRVDADGKEGQDAAQCLTVSIWSSDRMTADDFKVI